MLTDVRDEQTRLDAASPSASHCKCGEPQSPRDPSRCARGHVWIGATGPALTHGAHSRVVWQHEAEARRAIVAAILSDAGYTDADAAPRALVVECEGIAQAVLLRDSAYRRMVEAGGPLSANERRRHAYDIWLTSGDRVDRGVRVVGTRRVERTVSSLSALLAGPAATAQEPAQAPASDAPDGTV
jgi:hypothetical protein